MGRHHSGPNIIRTLEISVFTQDRSAEEDPDPTPGRCKKPRGNRQTVCKYTGRAMRATDCLAPVIPGDTRPVGHPSLHWMSYQIPTAGR